MSERFKNFRLLFLGLIFAVGSATAQDKPNILVVWGDDIGQSNISAYTFGLMGYKTPNIDRIAKEGMMFTDYYGEHHAFFGDAVDIRRLIANQAKRVGTDVGDANVVAPDDQDIWFVLGACDAGDKQRTRGQQAGHQSFQRHF